jgi:NAD(P)-dependent dehydrogenase (short-subunit alcohol dehydrogenase family)
LTGLAGKVAIVTGATSGVGRWTALGLAGRGATVIVTGRDSRRLADTKAWIETAHPGAEVHTEQADFASLRQVRAMAGRILAGHPKIAILVNNAGLIMTHRVTTEDGFETTWQVNHLAPFLLTNLLLPALRAGAPSRIVNVASVAANYGRIRFDDVNLERHMLGLAYPQSKLANIMFTVALARRLEGSGVIAAAVHPGFVASNFGRKGAISRPLWALLRPFQISEEQGAENSLYAATTDDVAAVSGRYLVAKKPAKLPGQSTDGDAVERLWRASADMVGIRA